MAQTRSSVNALTYPLTTQYTYYPATQHRGTYFYPPIVAYTVLQPCEHLRAAARMLPLTKTTHISPHRPSLAPRYQVPLEDRILVLLTKSVQWRDFSLHLKLYGLVREM